jgi:hypothetical protein
MYISLIQFFILFYVFDKFNKHLLNSENQFIFILLFYYYFLVKGRINIFLYMQQLDNL